MKGWDDMSVMLIDHEQAGNLINGIGQFRQLWGCCNFMGHTDIGQLHSEPLQKFIRKVYQANQDTWNKRYEESDMIPDILPATGEPMNKYQTLKTLEALHYNIELEYVPEFTVIYKQLEIMINDIKDNIIEALPEYEAAKWG
jgi:hypothetical protein